MYTKKLFLTEKKTQKDSDDSLRRKLTLKALFDKLSANGFTKYSLISIRQNYNFDILAMI